MAIQIVRVLGGIRIAVVADDSRTNHCLRRGARGVLKRREFHHWGRLPNLEDGEAYREWVEGVRQFRDAFWNVLGERKSPRIVLEHPGEQTIPTSVYLCDNAGMVVVCGGTSGYSADVDLRILWMRQKRLQGSHFANRQQCAAITHLVATGQVDPCLSRVLSFEEIGSAHQLMHDNAQPPGNLAVLINAPEPGLRDLPRPRLRSTPHFEAGETCVPASSH